MFTLAQMPTQMPELPKGPSLEHVRGPVEIPTYTTLQIGLATAFIAVCLIGLSYVLYRWLRNRKETLSPTPPYTALSNELNAAKLLPSEDDRIAPLVSKALRRYLSQQTSQPEGLSSQEWLKHFLITGRLSEKTIQSLQSTFSQLDRMKFAPIVHGASDQLELITKAEALAETLHKELEPEEDLKT